MGFTKEVVGNFYGNLNVAAEGETKESFFDILFDKAKLQTGLEESTPVNSNRHMSAVNSRDIKLNHLYAVVQRRKSHKAQLDLSFEVTKRMRTDHVFDSFKVATGTHAMNGPVRPRNFDCLKTLMSTFDAECGKMDDYSLQYVKHFVAACESGLAVDSLIATIKGSCSH